MPESSKESFETCVKKLEEIVEQLEAPDLPLDKSLKLFEEGIRLARNCEKTLSEAQGKVEKLMKENETFKKEPFAP